MTDQRVSHHRPGMQRPEKIRMVASATIPRCHGITMGVQHPPDWGHECPERSAPATTSHLATVLRRAAAKHGAEFVDPTPELDVWGDYLADHMHWSASGHERLAGVVTARIDVSPSTVGRQQ